MPMTRRRVRSFQLPGSCLRVNECSHPLDDLLWHVSCHTLQLKEQLGFLLLFSLCDILKFLNGDNFYLLSYYERIRRDVLNTVPSSRNGGWAGAATLDEQRLHTTMPQDRRRLGPEDFAEDGYHAGSEPPCSTSEGGESGLLFLLSHCLLVSITHSQT